ncbi:MAG TPA: hypothetical protein VHT30_13565, partial [Acidimicrobiales bacterium]|nr:hypothetical protein [Acidimicrobiales bacterium]
AWDDVKVEAVTSEPSSLVADLWTTRQVDASIILGKLEPTDVSVELLHGPVGPTGELVETSVVPLELVPGSEHTPGVSEGAYHYQGTFTCQRAGRYGIAVRVMPSHRDLAVPAEMGCITWA